MASHQGTPSAERSQIPVCVPSVARERELREAKKKSWHARSDHPVGFLNDGLGPFLTGRRTEPRGSPQRGPTPPLPPCYWKSPGNVSPVVVLVAVGLCAGLSLAVHALWTRYSDHGSWAAAEARLSSSGDFRSYAAATDAVQVRARHEV
ncbi:hypothetical protein MTO96_009439 [Rhipicephalus appendiculatus]